MRFGGQALPRADTRSLPLPKGGEGKSNRPLISLSPTGRGKGPAEGGKGEGARRNNVLLLPPPRQRFNHFPLERLAFFLVSVKKLA